VILFETKQIPGTSMLYRIQC